MKIELFKFKKHMMAGREAMRLIFKKNRLGKTIGCSLNKFTICKTMKYRNFHGQFYIKNVEFINFFPVISANIVIKSICKKVFALSVGHAFISYYGKIVKDIAILDGHKYDAILLTKYKPFIFEKLRDPVTGRNLGTFDYSLWAILCPVEKQIIVQALPLINTPITNGRGNFYAYTSPNFEHKANSQWIEFVRNNKVNRSMKKEFIQQMNDISGNLNMSSGNILNSNANIIAYDGSTVVGQCGAPLFVTINEIEKIAGFCIGGEALDLEYEANIIKLLCNICKEKIFADPFALHNYSKFKEKALSKGVNIKPLELAWDIGDCQQVKALALAAVNILENNSIPEKIEKSHNLFINMNSDIIKKVPYLLPPLLLFQKGEGRPRKR